MCPVKFKAHRVDHSALRPPFWFTQFPGQIPTQPIDIHSLTILFLFYPIYQYTFDHLYTYQFNAQITTTYRKRGEKKKKNKERIWYILLLTYTKILIYYSLSFFFFFLLHCMCILFALLLCSSSCRKRRKWWDDPFSKWSGEMLSGIWLSVLEGYTKEFV